MQIDMIEVINGIKQFVDPSLLELVAIGDQITTPDGRWQAVQDWLKAHPKWRKKVDKWFQLTPDVAYSQLKEAIIEDSNNPAMFRFLMNRFINEDLKSRIIKSIETLQTLYKERKGSTKNGRRKQTRAIGG